VLSVLGWRLYCREYHPTDLYMIDFSILDQHEKIALLASGGKDSLTCVHLLREYLDRITVYHIDTGDLLPEMMASAARIEAMVPKFVRVETHVSEWIDANGLPTDLMPYSAHPVARVMGQSGAKLVSRYDCCWANLMAPAMQRVYDDGITLLIRGTKRVDMPVLPAENLEVIADRITLWLPIVDWTHEQVFSYLALHKIPVPRVYDYVTNSPECARCSAWWGERRASYLKRHHPLLWADYDRRLQVVVSEIAGSLADLKREVES
jgi:3'-phosphoadenosine 5'-phosphosulfate sulfotransferase (PAPS reductase)/FAD synthetase